MHDGTTTAATRRPGKGMTVWRWALCAFALLAAGFVAVAAAQTPTQRVESTIASIIEVLHAEGASREEKWQRIGAIIDGGFDFRSMSQSVLARNWRAASKEEKRQFVEFFSQYLEETYRTKIESHTNQRVEVTKETVRGDRAVVDTAIVTDTTRVPVSYKLKNNDGTWYAYDVVIEGVSLVNNYRNTFDAIVKAEGMDGLLRDLEGRIAKHRAGQAAAP
ncbi:MAG: phospholipid-binding protein MlaC [Gammaproteobacteria bacterium]